MDAARVSPAARLAAVWIVALAGCGGAEATHLISANTGSGGASFPTVGEGGHIGTGIDAAVDMAPPVVTPTCSDNIRNGAETDVDCGGGAAGGCPVCRVGQACVAGTDCENGVCTNGFCRPAGCGDVLQDGSETDVDCGGSNCTPCADGLKCVLGTDCQSGTCTSSMCQGPRCDDGLKNGSETDTDCGGSCPKCATGLTCSGPGDCQSAVCNINCQPASCGDGIKNGSETDVDCGGTCSMCIVGKTCSAGTDCTTGVCNVTCRAPTCADGVRNGLETDVDCGGNGGTPASGCGACAAPGRCLVNADCISKRCVSSICQLTTCSDNVLNGSETDVDCGGSCATKCDGGKVCLVNADCSSNNCTGGICQSAWKVQYRCANTAAVSGQLQPSLQVVSTGGATAPLTEFTIRYWYTTDNLVANMAVSDFAVIGLANVTYAFVTPATARPLADRYLEIGFRTGAGSLVAGTTTGEIQTRFFDSPLFQAFTQTNDYSFDATKTAYADWTHVTLYHNGVLVWGVEP